MNWVLVYEGRRTKRYLADADVTKTYIWVREEQRFIRAELTAGNRRFQTRLPLRRSKRQQEKELLDWADRQILSPVQLLAQAGRAR